MLDIPNKERQTRSYRLTPEVITILEGLATAHKCSMSDVINALVMQYGAPALEQKQ